MANFIGGVIPTIKVSSNSVVNLATTNLAQNVANTGINVALGPVLATNVANSLGITPQSLDNISPSSIASGIFTTGRVAIDRFLADSIINSGAFGPLGPLATNLTSGLIGNLSNGVLSSPLDVGFIDNGDRWFPGAGDEPNADYGGGSAYTGGPAGADVVFSIKTAETLAFSEAMAQIVDPSVAFSMGPSEAFDSFDYSFNTTLPAGTIPQSNWNPGSVNYFEDVAASSVDGAFSFSPENLAAAGALNIYQSPPKDSWNFICAPDEISWSSEAQVERAQIFGTNQSPVTVGSKSMRDLNLGNALTEGFSRVKTVETKVAKLESLMNFTLDTKNSYVKVPVYYVTANNKKYGFGLEGKDGGYFVIKSINVKEELRDLRGDSTRSIVDVSFMQVPPYQVETGRDIASKSVRAQDSILGASSSKAAAVLKQAADSGRISSNTKGSTTGKSTSGQPATSGSSTNRGGTQGSKGSSADSREKRSSRAGTEIPLF